MRGYRPRGGGLMGSFSGGKPRAGLMGSFSGGKLGPGASSLVGKSRPAGKGLGANNQRPTGFRGGKPAPQRQPRAPRVARPPRTAPIGQHMVPDAAYNTAIDFANRSEEQRLNQLQGQETNIKHEFGIDDPTNPFSRAEGLKRAFLTRRKAASAGLASQGQLYSGAHERALARTRRDEEQARYELRSAYESAINQIGSAKAGVKFDTEEQRSQAFEDWLSRAPEADVPLAEEDLASEEGGGEAAPAPVPPQAAAPGSPAPPNALAGRPGPGVLRLPGVKAPPRRSSLVGKPGPGAMRLPGVKAKPRPKAKPAPRHEEPRGRVQARWQPPRRRGRR